MRGQKALGLGLVGAGGFGRFCLQAYSLLPDLKLATVCDSDATRLKNVAEQFGMKPYVDYASMLADPDVELRGLEAAARDGVHERMLDRGTPRFGVRARQ